jgi:hypothetical protein
MNLQTILFLDGSKTSQYLLNYIIKTIKFDIKKVIISPGCNKKFSDKIKKKFILIISNLKNKQPNLKKYDIGFLYYDFKVSQHILKVTKKIC